VGRDARPGDAADLKKELGLTTSIAERARELTDSRRPYVHATVVRAQEPTSAQPGDDALILADGSIEGFVGGVCAESSVRAAALDTLRDGNALLLRVLPDSGVGEFPESPGALVVVNPCHSGGALEIFLRPMLPKPLIGVAATTPIGAAVSELAEFLEYEVTAGDYRGASAVVVAGMGRDEEPAIRAALDAGVPFVALIASRTRGAVVLDEMGLTAAERARVRTHPGLDIGARTPKEIALAVLAEIVGAVRKDGLHAAPAPALLPLLEAPRQAVDPVCGMTVLIGPETPHARVGGQDHWFCCTGCLERYTA
jgi:xanthine dehydrogenase accessory factor